MAAAMIKSTALLSFFLQLHIVLAQRTSVIGWYVPEEQAPLTAIECGANGNTVWRDDSEEGTLLKFCDGDNEEDWVQPVSCHRDQLIVATTHLAEATDRSTLSCNGGCTALTIVDDFEEEGETYTLYDCITNLRGLEEEEPINTVFVTVPTSLLTRTEATSTTETETETATETNPDDDEEPPPEDDEDGPSAGLIAGATVGGVAGLALIAAAIFVIVRRRKRTHSAVPQTEPSQMADTTYGSPPPTSSPWTPPVAYQHTDASGTPMSYAQYPSQHNSMMGGVPGSTASPGSPPKTFYPSTMSGSEQGGWERPWGEAPPHVVQAELPTGPHAQGYASGEQHPVPYEMDATPDAGSVRR